MSTYKIRPIWLRQKDWFFWTNWAIDRLKFTHRLKYFRMCCVTLIRAFCSKWPVHELSMVEYTWIGKPSWDEAVTIK